MRLVAPPERFSDGRKKGSIGGAESRGPLHLPWSAPAVRGELVTFKTLIEWANENADRGRDEFVREHSHPFLVHRMQPEPQLKSSFRTAHARGPQPTPAEPHLIGELMRASSIAAAVARDPEMAVVLPVDKRAGAPFSEHLSVGRTPNTDVPVMSTGVSKFHAYFHRAEDGTGYFLTDASSTNGTYINGQRLEPKIATRIPDGAVVRFAFWHAHFYLADRFFDLLEEVRSTLSK